MKIYLLAISMLITTSMHARTKDTISYRFKTQLSIFCSFSSGPYSTKSTLYIPQRNVGSPGFGFLMFDINPVAHLDIGLKLSSFSYEINDEKFETQIRNLYTLPDYYNRFTFGKQGLSMTSWMLECGYFFKYRFMEIEPYIQLGWATYSGTGDATLIHRKKMQENYSELIDLHIGHGSFFYPGIGLHINLRIFKALYGVAGIQYNRGTIGYTFIEKRTEFLNGVTSSDLPFKQPLATLQLETGLQVRMGRWYKDRNPRAK